MTAVQNLSTSTSIRLITIRISMPYRPWSSSRCCLSRTVNLLSNKEPLANLAVDWLRFAKAALSQVSKALDMQDQSAGGSTLATQVESIVILPMD